MLLTFPGVYPTLLACLQRAVCTHLLALNWTLAFSSSNCNSSFHLFSVRHVSPFPTLTGMKLLNTVASVLGVYRLFYTFSALGHSLVSTVKQETALHTTSVVSWALWRTEVTREATHSSLAVCMRDLSICAFGSFLSGAGVMTMHIMYKRPCVRDCLCTLWASQCP